MHDNILHNLIIEFTDINTIGSKYASAGKCSDYIIIAFVIFSPDLFNDCLCRNWRGHGLNRGKKIIELP